MPSYQPPIQNAIHPYQAIVNAQQHRNEEQTRSDKKPDTKLMSGEDQQRHLDRKRSQLKLTEDHQILVNNLRVLEVIQRQIFLNPNNLMKLQQQRTTYYNTISSQIKSLGLDIGSLKTMLSSIDLLGQLNYAIEYVNSSADIVSLNQTKMSRLQQYFGNFLNAIASQTTENCTLKEAIKEITDLIEEIQGHEGCMPINWNGTTQIKQLQAEICEHCLANPTLVESYQHWNDRLSSLYYNQIIDRKWL